MLVKLKIQKFKVHWIYIGRKENIKNAFIVNNKNIVCGKKIIILDDICTTGNTVNEMARVLKDAGADKILVIALAKDWNDSECSIIYTIWKFWST